MSNANRPTIIVTGLMRSGTSAMMQALAAAGVRCLGDAPGYEDARVMEEGMIAIAAMLDAQGGAIKVLEPHLRPPPDGFDCLAIHMVRLDKKEQAKSYLKLIRTQGERLSVTPRKALSRLRTMLHAHQKAADMAVASWPFPSIRIAFEEMVENPGRTLLPIAERLEIDPDEMASAFVKRGIKCLPHLLERTLPSS